MWDFPKIRVPYFGVLIIRTLLFNGTIGSPIFGNPHVGSRAGASAEALQHWGVGFKEAFC